MERQHVNLAVFIFRPEITATLKLFCEKKVDGFENVDATVEFLEMFRKWYFCHDVSNTTEGVRKRLEDKMPYTSLDDSRLKFMELEFPGHMKRWKWYVDDLIRKLPNKTPEDKKKLPQRRRNALQKKRTKL